MRFDKDFFKSEVRSDFAISEKMKKVWAVELDLLEKLLEVCKKHDIKVMVYAGTLLGTIRHKGFIPWDDDIDVCLLRKDYNRLLAIADQEFTAPYFFQTAYNDREFFCAYARLRNSNTTGIIIDSNSTDYNNGIFIDVFVLDGYTENAEDFKAQTKEKYRLMRLIDNYHRTLRSKSLVKRTIYGMIHPFEKYFIKYETLLDRYNQVIQRFNDSTSRVSLITHGGVFPKKYWCEKQDFDYIIYLPFESLMVPVPKRYDIILKHMYGDYMSFPPVDKRGAWHADQFIVDPDMPYKTYYQTIANTK